LILTPSAISPAPAPKHAASFSMLPPGKGRASNPGCLKRIALAVALDFRVMARDAHMRVPEIGLGMNMSWQSVPRMLHLMGPARTKQAVILADQRISAAEAYEWRLVEEVAEPGKAFDAAMALAAKVAAQPPLSVAMTKLTVNRLAHALDDLASHMDVDQFALASMTEDHKEGVQAFLERRKPRFKGR
jgi:enoyl-CoA hydratase